MKKDDFGDRMKNYEFVETQRKFLPMLPIYARLDGKNFSKFTKGFVRPYDIDMAHVMTETAKFVMEQSHAKIVYHQSDEISLCWYNEDYKGEIFFDGKIQKMTSVLAGMASSKFMLECLNRGGLIADRARKLIPAFDCRVFQLPNKVECTNAFLWRENDATKNAITMAASVYYSHKELDGKSGPEKQEMLFQKGINFNDYPPEFKRGSFWRKENVEVELSDEILAKIPEKNRPENGKVIRSITKRIDMPKFSSVSNRVEVIFDGENPVTFE